MAAKKVFAFILILCFSFSFFIRPVFGEGNYTAENLKGLQDFLVYAINEMMNQAAGTQGQNYALTRQSNQPANMLLTYNQTLLGQEPDRLSLVSQGVEYYWLFDQFTDSQTAQKAFNLSIYACLVLFPALPYTYTLTNNLGNQETLALALNLNQQGFSADEIAQYIQQAAQLNPEETLTEQEAIKGLEGHYVAAYITLLSDFIEQFNLVQPVNDQLLAFIEEIDRQGVAPLYQ